MNKKKGMKNWVKVCVGLAIMAILFANPYTRPIIHFILPLGSGIDDLIVMVALIWLVAILIYRAIVHRKKINEWMQEEHLDEDGVSSDWDFNNLNKNSDKGEKNNEKEF